MPTAAPRRLQGPDDLATQTLVLVEHHNLTAQPFAWTYAGKVLKRMRQRTSRSDH